MVPLINLGLKALVKESSRLGKNIAARAARNPDNAAFQRAAELRALPAPKTRNEALSRAAELSRLDASAATRKGGAEKAATRERRVETRQATKEFMLRNPRQLPPAADVKELTDSTLKSLRAKAKRVVAETGDTFATRALERWEEERNPDATPRQKTAELRRLLDISEYQGIDIKGARKQEKRGVEAFGDQYRDWTNQEKGAAWEGFKEYAASLSSNVSSDRVLADFKEAVAEGVLSVQFYTVRVSNGRGDFYDELRAATRPNLNAAQAEASKQKFQAERLRKIDEKTDPDTVAPLW